MAAEPVLAIPRSAVLQPGPEAIVFIEGEGNVYERRKIKLGRKGDDYFEALAGLQPGERVVASGNLLLDSQAQLNPAHGRSHQHEVEEQSVPPSFKPDEMQLKAADRLFSLAAELGAALAQDDLKRFESGVKNSSEVGDAMAKAFPKDIPDPALRDSIAELGRGILPAAANLEEARAGFEPWSKAAVQFAREWRKLAPSDNLRLFRCPMYPKAGKSGYWLQMDMPLQNPFFGSKMIDCGTEIP
jgi:hypothetical protein